MGQIGACWVARIENAPTCVGRDLPSFSKATGRSLTLERGPFLVLGVNVENEPLNGRLVQVKTCRRTELRSRHRHATGKTSSDRHSNGASGNLCASASGRTIPRDPQHAGA